MGQIMHCAPSVCVLTALRSHLGQTPHTNYMAGRLVSAFFSALKPPRLSACQVRCMLCAEAFACTAALTKPWLWAHPFIRL